MGVIGHCDVGVCKNIVCYGVDVYFPFSELGNVIFFGFDRVFEHLDFFTEVHVLFEVPEFYVVDEFVEYSVVGCLGWGIGRLDWPLGDRRFYVMVEWLDAQFWDAVYFGSSPGGMQGFWVWILGFYSFRKVIFEESRNLLCFG